ncbi:piggyBac transposable element-derived protein 3-like [Sitophilus oryzae]|uniref:PiggyBac transposable element-derived protein 3-like n=1 Tax=Sitophilus oryzae TaxID=7048 RepID=A0A6J2YND3_SITOR|nr:piggyBac transposable element-derived protein 3-like [Sitophilus oryzae]
MYATHRNKPGFQLDIDDIYTYLGILFLSGYAPLPRRRMYWETSEDVHNTLVSKSMRRTRFFEISSNLHAAGNDNLPENDKLGKVRYLIDALNTKFLQYAPLQSNILIDESMIPYYGRHGCKQYIRGKPIRFGYKAIDVVKGMGLGETVVFHFANIIKNHFADQKLSLYFDNFFTSAKLVSMLGQIGIGATGTTREHRTGKCSLIENAKIKKFDRGAMCSAFDARNNIVGVCWKDNNVVTLMSNEFGLEPVLKCKRYSAKERSKVDIPQPYVVNSTMHSWEVWISWTTMCLITALHSEERSGIFL